MLHRKTIFVGVFFVAVAFSSPVLAQSSDPREEAAVGIGLTAGNLFFVPLKVVSAATGAISGALSFVLWGGDTEVAQQTWQNTLPPPYVITPELARAAIGSRPELEEK